MLWAGEWNATAEGTQEKVWACRRSKAPLLGRVRGGWADGHRNLPAHASSGSQRAGHLCGRLLVSRSHLLGLREMGSFLCRQHVAGNLLCGLRAAGAQCNMVPLV